MTVQKVDNKYVRSEKVRQIRRIILLGGNTKYGWGKQQIINGEDNQCNEPDGRSIYCEQQENCCCNWQITIAERKRQRGWQKISTGIQLRKCFAVSPTTSSRMRNSVGGQHRQRHQTIHKWRKESEEERRRTKENEGERRTTKKNEEERRRTKRRRMKMNEGQRRRTKKNEEERIKT